MNSELQVVEGKDYLAMMFVEPRLTEKSGREEKSLNCVSWRFLMPFDGKLVLVFGIPAFWLMQCFNLASADPRARISLPHSLIALSSETNDKLMSEDNQTQEVEPNAEDAVYDLASARAKRANHSTYMMLSTLLMYNGLGLGFGGTVGHYFTPDFMFEASLLGMASFLPKFQLTRHFTVGLRTMGESFYIVYAVGCRVYDRDDQLDDFVDEVAALNEERDPEPDTYYEFRDVGLDLTIGTRWQWDAFVLEIDWLGIYFPMKRLQVTEVTEDRLTGSVTTNENIESPESAILDRRLFSLKFGFSF